MATSKAQSLPGGIVKLTKLLEHLNKPPKLTFTNNVKGLRLTLAYQNDHWGARHFVKEDLPRIRHANPDIDIDVIKWRKQQNEHWRPELAVKFDDGDVEVVDMNDKPSSTILKEVMTIAGGDPWKIHVEDSKKAGTPIVPGELLDDKQMKQVAQKKSLPNLWEFLKANPQKERKAEQVRKEREERKAQNKKGDAGKREAVEVEVEVKSVSEVLPTSETTPSCPRTL